jgi:aminopeptidase
MDQIMGPLMTSTPDNYVPSSQVLQNYAHILVNFALNSGKGVKKGEVVQCVVPDIAKPLALELQNVILQAGAHPMIRLIPSGFEKDFYAYANKEQLQFFPRKFIKARVDLVDHNISIIAEVDPFELQKVDPQKIVEARNSKKEHMDWLRNKETQGLFTWTAALWGTEAKAKEVGLSMKEYWQQIIRACFLDKADPVQAWKQMNQTQMKMKKTLNAMRIASLHVEGPDVDLTIQLGADRIWNAGSGRNVPSFEFFTSPHCRGTEGWIKFNQPVYRYGNVMKDISLEFKQGKIVKSHAKVGNRFLQEMLKTKNADMIGEFSLTDKRMSRITHVMAETLYDENISGPYGNTHLAVGMAYRDCYRGDPKLLTVDQWEEIGFNDSAEHTDIISTTDRTVTAKLISGEEKVIYKKGMFTFADVPTI